MKNYIFEKIFQKFKFKLVGIKIYKMCFFKKIFNFINDSLEFDSDKPK